jgi:hypothetical protein
MCGPRERHDETKAWKLMSMNIYQEVPVGVPKAFFTTGITIEHFLGSFRWFNSVKGWVRRG